MTPQLWQHFQEQLEWQSLRDCAERVEQGHFLWFRQEWDAAGRLSIRARYAGAVHQVSISGKL